MHNSLKTVFPVCSIGSLGFLCKYWLSFNLYLKLVTWLFYLQEHIDYDVVKSANPEFKKATVRINIFKQHRQTIQVRR
jgi:hypothetical protein